MTEPLWTKVPAPRGRLYECPRWVDEADCFQWVDILNSSVLRWGPGGAEPAEIRRLDLDYVTSALPVDGDVSYVTSKDTVHRYSWSEQKLVPVARIELGPDLRFNDGGIAPDGTVYIGTMSMAGALADGSLFQLDGDQLVPVLTGVGISNGLVWLDSSTCLYVDSKRGEIERLDFRAVPVGRETFVDLGPDSEPDGLALAEGLVFAALWGSSALVRVSRADRRTDRVPVPGRYPSSLAFDRSGRFALLTTALEDDQENGGYAWVCAADEITAVGRTLP